MRQPFILIRMKNLLLRGVVKLLNRFVRKQPRADRFLIVSTTGLGDSLWGTPALRALRTAHPRAYIAILTTPLGMEIYGNNPHLDACFVLQKPLLFSFVKLYRTLRKKNFDIVFLFHFSQRATLPFCAVLGAREIVATEGSSKGFDDMITVTLPKKQQHEIARRLDLVGTCCRVENGIDMEMYPDIYAEEEAKQFLRLNHRESLHPLVILHPGAKDRFKQWPPHYFVALGNRLKQHLGCHLVISGSSDETALVQEIASQIPGSIPLHGALRLHAFARLIQKCAVFITNDTGPMHLAFAMQTPTVALFTPTDPTLCGPYYMEKVIVLSKQPTCVPCLKKRCHHPFCLMQISPHLVFNAALKLFYTSHGQEQV